jgi:hypothetical protein
MYTIESMKMNETSFLSGVQTDNLDTAEYVAGVVAAREPTTTIRIVTATSVVAAWFDGKRMQ